MKLDKVYKIIFYEENQRFRNQAYSLFNEDFLKILAEFVHM